MCPQFTKPCRRSSSPSLAAAHFIQPASTHRRRCFKFQAVNPLPSSPAVIPEIHKPKPPCPLLAVDHRRRCLLFSPKLRHQSGDPTAICPVHTISTTVLNPLQNHHRPEPSSELHHHRRRHRSLCLSMPSLNPAHIVATQSFNHHRSTRRRRVSF